MHGLILYFLHRWSILASAYISTNGSGSRRSNIYADPDLKSKVSFQVYWGPGSSVYSQIFQMTGQTHKQRIRIWILTRIRITKVDIQSIYFPLLCFLPWFRNYMVDQHTLRTREEKLFRIFDYISNYTLKADKKVSISKACIHHVRKVCWSTIWIQRPWVSS